MNCPFCSNEDTKVLDKRESNEDSTRRRRECLNCNKRFTTYERIESTPLIIVKKNQNREQFDRGKLLKGLFKACEKRPIPEEKIAKMANSIESELRKQNSEEVPSNVVGELIMNQLKELDEVAYVRFASVYRQFKDIASFEKELKNLKRAK